MQLNFFLQVSWLRHRDTHLLTVGHYTYTSDQRFRAIHHQQTEDWTLQIKYPQHRDSGIYECQISTTQHLSLYIHLNVVGKLDKVRTKRTCMMSKPASLPFITEAADNWIIIYLRLRQIESRIGNKARNFFFPFRSLLVGTRGINVLQKAITNGEFGWAKTQFHICNRSPCIFYVGAFELHFHSFGFLMVLSFLGKYWNSIFKEIFKRDFFNWVLCVIFHSKRYSGLWNERICLLLSSF